MYIYLRVLGVCVYTIELIDFIGLNYIMFAHNIVHYKKGLNKRVYLYWMYLDGFYGFICDNILWLHISPFGCIFVCVSLSFSC